MDIISHEHGILLNRVMTSLNMVNHTPPWTYFLNTELIIQIISIKTQQSMTRFIFKATLGKLAKRSPLILFRRKSVYWIYNSRKENSEMNRTIRLNKKIMSTFIIAKSHKNSEKYMRHQECTYLAGEDSSMHKRLAA